MYFENLLFADSFCQLLSQHSDGSNYVTNNPQLVGKNFTQKYLFLQKHMKNTLFVTNTASPITTTRRFLYPHVKNTFYYLEKLRNCYINWTHFVSPINTRTASILCSSTASIEKILQRVEMCLTMCREQSPLTKETHEWT